jgi:ankyrin repeat protein
MLASRGADLTIRDAKGRTLLYATLPEPGCYYDRSHTSVELSALLKSGADVNQPNANGECPLHAAARLGWPSALSQLLGAGADANARVCGYTPLHAAARSGRVNLDVIAALVGAGADPNAQDSSGDTAFHCALQNRCGGRDGVSALLRHGAHPPTANAAGVTPFHVMVANRDAEGVEMMLGVGADARAVAGDGSTCLHILCRGLGTAKETPRRGCDDDHRILRALIAAGANPGTADAAGQNALAVASGIGWTGFWREVATAMAASNAGLKGLVDLLQSSGGQ